MISCQVCGNQQGNISHRFREMMYGTREEFDYIECSDCGTIQTTDMLQDLSRYYPEDYYSYNSAQPTFSDKWTTRMVARMAAKHFLGQPSLLGALFAERKAWTKDCFPPFLAGGDLGLRLDSSIVDVGCGDGQLLETLSFFGFSNLTGADPFIDRDVETPSGVKIYKKPIEQLDRTFDLIMFNHSYEHVTDPVETLRAARDRVAIGGLCLVRMPVIAEAWKIYGKDWVQLDPPRHTFIFTQVGFERFASSLGFETVKVTYDSGGFQFWGSELYRQDKPLQGALSTDISEHFDSERLEEWERSAERLNRSQAGDQACFFLKETSNR